MPSELHDSHLTIGETDETVAGTPPTTATVATQSARRALDHAVMAIFELAFSLESLTDAIGRLNAEASCQLAEYQQAGVESA